ncbi:MAG: S41 family peptidase [Cyclobacteriaceae bacterium]|nr:S41 family peptidase [Cyclobacteriaceae bacterium]
MIKYSVIVIVFTLITSKAYSQFPVPVDTIYNFIRHKSIHRNSVQWEVIDKEFYKKLASAKTPDDTLKCFVMVFERLGDVHSQLYFNNKIYSSYPVFSDDELKRLVPLVNRSNAEAGNIKTSLLLNRFVYLQIPGITAWGDQINEYAQAINDSICKYDSKKPKGVIVDLRLNGGGNIKPMLAGVSMLLGNVYLGGTTDIADNVLGKWQIDKGNLYMEDYKTTDITSKCTGNYEKMPVVILTGPVTKSSGSMTAIAFKGRRKTYFIGEPTADGYTTGNSWNELSEGLVLNLSTSFVADRNGTIYKTTVAPDLLITAGDNFDDLLHDEKIKAAIKWLDLN